VYAHAKEAVDIARSGGGPTLLELKTFRLCGHSRRDPNNYMTKEEKQMWAKKDPIPFYEKILIEEKILDSKKISEMKKEVEGEVEAAIKFGQESPSPQPEDTYTDFYVTMEVPR
jgi:TPP-dependent pyruvate/acetoin dehydrogenase alpha subunit